MPELKLGIVGCGRVTEVFHLPALHRSRLWSVAAVSDPLQARLVAVHGQVPKASLWKDAREMIAQERLDALLIATSPEGHRKWVAEALSAGLHILVEKPGGMSVEESRAMAELAKGRVAWVGYNRRFMAPYRELRRALAEQPGYVLKHAHSDMTFSVEEWRPVSGYLGDAARGGSVAHDVLAHQVDLLPWIFDDVIAEVMTEQWEDPPGSQGVIRFVLTMESGREVRGTARHGAHYQEHLEVRLAGSTWLAIQTGLLHSSYLSPSALEKVGSVKRWLDGKWIRLGFAHDPIGRSFADQWRAFGECILGKRPGSAGVSMDGLVRRHQVLDALRSSAELRRPVRPFH